MSLRGFGGQPFRERADGVLDERARLPGAVCGWGRLGLLADHLDRRAHGLGRRASSGRAVVALGGTTIVSMSGGPGGSPGCRWLTRDERRLVSRMNLPEPVLGGLLLAVLASLVEVTAVETTRTPGVRIESTCTGLACLGMQIIARAPDKSAA
jgi:hypothetical protein